MSGSRHITYVPSHLSRVAAFIGGKVYIGDPILLAADYSEIVQQYMNVSFPSFPSKRAPKARQEYPLQVGIAMQAWLPVQ